MAQAEKKGWKVTGVGELMVSRPFSMHTEPDFLAIKEILKAADVGYGHLEMNFIDPDNMPFPARGDSAGSYMNTDPIIAKDIKWLGVDIMSLAHNHSYDFGAAGILQNRSYCTAAGIAGAGTGRNLEEAGAPVYFESAAGRVALISATSGNKSNEWANLAKGNIPARPGVNPLRVHTRFHITRDVAEAMKKMGKALHMITTNDDISDGGEKKTDGFSFAGSAVGSMGMSAGEFSIGPHVEKSHLISQTYVPDDDFGIEMYCDKKDLARIIRNVESARKTSDLLMVAHHFNISEGARGDVPPAFAIEFAHAAIDAGADMYWGHGWHRTLGIEIYKGKPIIYGVGNMFAQSMFLSQVPYDSYEVWNHDMSKLAILTPNDEPLHPGLNKPSPLWWSSAIYEYEFDADRNIKSIKLTPVELGRDYSYTDIKITRHTGSACEGRPLIAHGENARLTLERFQKLSAPFGTEITIEGDVGYWRA